MCEAGSKVGGYTQYGIISIPMRISKLTCRIASQRISPEQEDPLDRLYELSAFRQYSPSESSRTVVGVRKIVGMYA